VTCAALAAGKHVLCEARMAMNAAEAHEMLETSRHHPDLVAQIVPSPFTFKWDATIHDYVNGGKLGDLIAVDLRGGTGGFPDASAPANWRQDRDLSGYNIMGMGIWYEALMRWTGPAVSIQAMCQTVVKRRPAADGQGYTTMTIPDHVDVLARLANGAQARLQFTSVLGHAADPWGCWLYGSEGTLHLDARAGVLRYGARGSEALEAVAIEPDMAGAWRVEADFIDAIRGLAPVRLTPFADGVRYMEFTEAVTRSAQLGQVIHLPL
jgi:predicted dehydrogenase